MLRRFAFVLIAFFPLTLASAQSTTLTPPLEYTVSFEQAHAHYAAIELRIPAHEAAAVELMMPTWVPGSYLIREYARHVDEITAADGSGKPLSITKTSKNRWQVELSSGHETRINYRLYCRDMSVRTNWIDHDMAVLNGGATFITLADAHDRPHQVRFELPKHWSRSVTALSPVEGLEHTYLAKNLDELIDAPVICGNPIIEDFVAGGVPHVVANLGDFDLWDTNKAAQDVQKIVEQQQQLWGNVPYERYKFLNVSGESGGGLEHDNSTLVMTSRWNYRDPQKYQDWLSLISHEFFHTWNVRRLRPADLKRYNYEQENLTRSLWIAEGVTSYYEDLVLVRAGLIDRATYLKRLSKQIEKLQTTPGRNVQSLSDASYDAWIKYYRPDENSNNSRISYYIKGCVVAFLLDARIREATNGTKSLDDLMRLLYADHAQESGFTEADFTRAANSVAGLDLSDWFEKHINRVEEVDYQPALDWLGLQFAGSPSNDSKSGKADTSQTEKATDTGGAAETDTTAATADPNTDQKPDQNNVAEPDNNKGAKEKSPPKAWLGMKAVDNHGQLVVTAVTANSPAHASGLNVGDELIAFNQYRVSGNQWQTQLNQLGIDHEIRIMIARRGTVRTIGVTAIAEPEENWNLKVVDPKSEQFESRIRSWLGETSAGSK